MTEINQNTVIDTGLQLSKNFLIDHLSTGAYHPVVGKWLPTFTAKLIPQQYNHIFTPGQVPLWQIARNLQIGADGIMENLLAGFGGDLRIKAGFLNNLPVGTALNEIKHLTGLSFDIQIESFSDNIYHAAKEIQKLAGMASSIDLIYGNSSWAHIEFDPKRILNPLSGTAEPIIRTVDSITGVVEQGITSIKGFF